MLNRISIQMTMIASCILLQSCVQTNQPPQIAAEPANPVIKSAEETISGNVLKSCFKGAPKILSKIHEDSVAHYSQYATSKLAAVMRRSPDDIPLYADRVRGYVFEYEATFFGTRQVQAICYYGTTPAGLKFAASISADERGSVPRDAIVGAVIDVYKSVSGKSLSFGKTALLAMTISP